MKNSLIIAKREIKSFFSSPAAYIVLIVFSLISTWFFIMPLFTNGIAALSSLFSTIQIVFLAFIPVITMGALSRERNTGTIEILLTLPISAKDVILGKYFFSLFIILVSLLFTFPQFLTIAILGSSVDFGVIFCGYLGLALISAVYCAIGIFCSTLTSNQIVSFIISFLILLALFSMEFALIYLPARITPFFQYLSITWQFSNLYKGVIDSRVLVYFSTLIFTFLFFAVEMLNKKKN